MYSVAFVSTVALLSLVAAATPSTSSSSSALLRRRLRRPERGRMARSAGTTSRRPAMRSLMLLRYRRSMALCAILRDHMVGSPSAAGAAGARVDGSVRAAGRDVRAPESAAGRMAARKRASAVCALALLPGAMWTVPSASRSVVDELGGGAAAGGASVVGGAMVAGGAVHRRRRDRVDARRLRR